MQINEQARAARSDDVCRVKNQILKHIPKMQIDGTPCESVPTELDKTDRGFYHTTIGRLLVGRNHRDQYDCDPDRYVILYYRTVCSIVCRFCAAVTEGRCQISVDDLPSFIYPVEGCWNATMPLEGCLQSEFLLKASHFSIGYLFLIM